MIIQLKTEILGPALCIRFLVGVAVVGVFLWQLAPGFVQAAEGAADPYVVLYDVLMTRYGADGKSYAENETSPALFELSDFPFGDKTYKKFNAALDAFAALPLAQVKAYSDVKRALLQRHLWKIFDATLPGRQQQLAATFPDRRFPAVRSHADRRAATRPRIAALIQRLALTRAHILALPHTLTETVESGGFAPAHDPDEMFKPFLPAGLYTKEGSWVCLGEAGVPVPADEHATEFQWRSAFVSFMSVPGGRLKTLQAIGKIKRNGELPVGTRFALVEQAFLISNDCQLILSPLIVSVSLRAYTRLSETESARPSKPFRAIQSVAEFVMQPRRLMQGSAVMKALKPGDYRYEVDDTGATGGLTGVDDIFEAGSLATSVRRSRLHRCSSCHFQAKSSRPKLAGLRTARAALLKEGAPEAIIKATVIKKTEHNTWKQLQALWQADLKNGDAQLRGNVKSRQLRKQ